MPIDPKTLEAMRSLSKQAEIVKKSLGGETGIQRLRENLAQMQKAAARAAEVPDLTKTLRESMAAIHASMGTSVPKAVTEAVKGMQASVAAFERARRSALEDVGAKSTASAQARQELEDAVRRAHGLGISLRELARSSGLSHETVRRVVNADENRSPH